MVLAGNMCAAKAVDDDPESKADSDLLDGVKQLVEEIRNKNDSRSLDVDDTSIF